MGESNSELIRQVLGTMVEHGVDRIMLFGFRCIWRAKGECLRDGEGQIRWIVRGYRGGHGVALLFLRFRDWQKMVEGSSGDGKGYIHSLNFKYLMIKQFGLLKGLSKSTGS